ncbi:MAG: response regulator [Betaproteobacteria bacterium]|nr:response regulator [Betaproteobacteria bacterium]
MYRVMLVEDDAKLATLVAEYLQAHEFAVDIVPRGDTALARFTASRPDIVVLDLMLPGLDGMRVCRQIRDISSLPILILTAREDSYDEVFGLEQGADDYVNKPVQPRVLLARLRALLRRTGDAVADEPGDLVFGALSISRENRSVTWRGTSILLNNPEYKLLVVLAEAAGQVLSRDDIFKKLRGFEFDGQDRSIDNCISRLRRKFSDESMQKIKTVWGEGYLFSPSAWA